MRLPGSSKHSNKKSGSFLDRIGLHVEKAPTPQEERSRERDEQIKAAWVWLRKSIDKGINHYYRSGSFEQLERVVDRPALDALQNELHELRSDNIYWEQPNRQTATEPVITVQDVKMGTDRGISEFTIRERFKDFSTHQRVVDNKLVPDAVANGKERVIEAVVSVRGGSDYKLRSVRQVSSAMLG